VTEVPSPSGKSMIRETERAAVFHNLFACTMLRTVRNIQFFMNLGYRAKTFFTDHYDRRDLICFAKHR
jgi:hypothetical protein